MAEGAVELEAEVGDGGGGDGLEGGDLRRGDVGGELAGGGVAPVGGDFFGVKRGELALGFVGEGEVEGKGRVGLAVAERGLGLAGVVVAVVVEEDDLAADLGLEAAGGDDLSVEEAPREKTAGLLAETDDGGGHYGDGTLSVES